MWPSVCEVRGRVVEAHEAEPVRPAARLVVDDEAREERAVALALDEAEGSVAERRGDGEEGDLVAARILDAANVVDRRASAALEQAERLVHVLDLEVQRPDAVGVLLEPARCAPAFAARRDADHRAVAREERERLLPPALGQLVGALADLGEVHHVGVEAAAALEVVDVVVHRLEPLDAERLGLGHRTLPHFTPTTPRHSPKPIRV